jgi:lipid-binding SYLF domain-containing protein
MSLPRRRLLPTVLALGAVPGAAHAARRADIDAGIAAALPRLRADNLTRVMSDTARAMLVFPRVTQGGLLLGFQAGDGALLEAEQVTGYYRLAGTSLGAVIGLQHFSLAVFLMDERALTFFRRSSGWDLGLEARVVGGRGGLTDATTLASAIGTAYAITFDESGALLSLAVEGTRVSPLAVD